MAKPIGPWTQHRVGILFVLVLALAFYMWTAATSIPFTFNSHNADVYNLLTTAFLHGHTYLPIKPPAGLLHLADPYDPAQNAPYQAAYHDLSLRNGHFYSSWGPTPLTLFLPFRVTGLAMSESFAAALFAFVGLVFAVALMRVLVRRLVPQTPGWLLVVASVGIALTNVVPFILRRPAQYEVAISSGYCFEMAGLYLVVTAALASPARRGRLAWGSLCLGLAVGARPPLAVCGAVALAAALYVIRRRNEGYRLLVHALGPFVVCGLLLAAYNYVRFGSVAEFGEHYQLAALNTMTKPTDQLAYVLPGLYSYLIVPARLALTFPHAFLMTAAEYPGSLPAGYAGSVAGGQAEPAGGLLTTMPITLLLLTLPLLWWRGKRAERPALLVCTGLVGVGLVIVVLLSWAVWGTTQRYEVDYATLFLIPAFLIWALLLAHRPGRRLARRVIAVTGIVLTAVGGAVGTAVSFTGYYDILRLTHPGLFSILEDITSPFATLATMVAGRSVVVRVAGPLPTELPIQRYTSFGEGGAGTWLGAGTVTVTVDAPHAERLDLTALTTLGPGAPRRGKLAVRVQSPGRAAITVPAATGYLRLPVRLHWGLNRINLGLLGPESTSPEVLYLAHIELHH